jgi:hypothetical protein
MMKIHTNLTTESINTYDHHYENFCKKMRHH